MVWQALKVKIILIRYIPAMETDMRMFILFITKANAGK